MPANKRGETKDKRRHLPKTGRPAREKPYIRYENHDITPEHGDMPIETPQLSHDR